MELQCLNFITNEKNLYVLGQNWYVLGVWKVNATFKQITYFSDHLYQNHCSKWFLQNQQNMINIHVSASQMKLT